MKLNENNIGVFLSGTLIGISFLSPLFSLFIMLSILFVYLNIEIFTVKIMNWLMILEEIEKEMKEKIKKKR